MKCNLCNEENIKDYHEYLKTDADEREDCIVCDTNQGTFGYWIEEDDWYYSGWRINLNYCPNCGKKLVYNWGINLDAE